MKKALAHIILIGSMLLPVAANAYVCPRMAEPRLPDITPGPVSWMQTPGVYEAVNDTRNELYWPKRRNNAYLADLRLCPTVDGHNPQPGDTFKTPAQLTADDNN